MTFVPSEDSDQPRHPLCTQCVAKEPSFLRLDLEAVFGIRHITTKFKDCYFDCLAFEFTMFITMATWPKVCMSYTCMY